MKVITQEGHKQVVRDLKTMLTPILEQLNSTKNYKSEGRSYSQSQYISILEKRIEALEYALDTIDGLNSGVLNLEARITEIESKLNILDSDDDGYADYAENITDGSIVDLGEVTT